MRIKQRLEQIRDYDPPIRTRGEWNHYQCITCDDGSAHMGINMADGRVKCLRCGFSFRLDSSAVVQKEAPKPSVYDSLIDMGGSEHPWDDKVRKYMAGRGIEPLSGWGYGRGEFSGMVALPVYSIKNRIIYAQWRSTSPTAHLRYISLSGAIPRLCYLGSVPNTPKTLVLTEGPMDAIAVRESTGMWASSTFGASTNIARDIFQAHRKGRVSSVVILYDDDSSGRDGMRRLERHLKISYGIRRVSSGTIRGADPAEATTEQRKEKIAQLIKQTRS